MPSTLIMFALSSRMGALADRYGPRLFMAGGPLLAAAGSCSSSAPGSGLVRLDLLPPLIVFALGLAVIVAPLTATVLADADETDAGIASAINNAIARVAGLVGISAIGAVVAGRLAGDTFAPTQQSVDAFHVAIVICAALVAAGGVVAALGIRNPRRAVSAEACPGGQFAGAPRPAAQRSLTRARRPSEQDACGERGRTAALEQLDGRVQVDLRLGQQLGEVRRVAGVEQHRQAPALDLVVGQIREGCDAHVAHDGVIDGGAGG